MLEVGSALATWSIPLPPNPRHVCHADRLANHRTAYLDYEGPVSGDRGTVSRWDHGTYEPLDQGDTRVEILLHGEKLHGKVVLECLPETPDQWQFTYLPESI